MSSIFNTKEGSEMHPVTFIIMILIIALEVALDSNFRQLAMNQFKAGWEMFSTYWYIFLAVCATPIIGIIIESILEERKENKESKKNRIQILRK